MNQTDKKILKPADRKMLIFIYEAERRTTQGTDVSHRPHGLSGRKERTQRAISKLTNTDISNVCNTLLYLMEIDLVIKERPIIGEEGFRRSYIYSLTDEGRKYALESLQKRVI